MVEITWLGITHDELAAEVARRNDVPLNQAEVSARKLAKLDPLLKAGFREYWDTGRIDDTVRIEGITAKQRMEETGFTPIGVFLDLDWLIGEPEAAKEAFAHGWDRIGPRPSQ